MRHSKSRSARPVARFAPGLTEAEIVQMMLPPYLHLQMLMDSSEPNPQYLASLVGVFNVATALAYMHKDRHAISLYESIQDILIDAARSGLNTPEKRERLQRVFCIADGYIEAQNKADLLRAIRLVEYQIANGSGTHTIIPSS